MQKEFACSLRCIMILSQPSSPISAPDGVPRTSDSLPEDQSSSMMLGPVATSSSSASDQIVEEQPLNPTLPSLADNGSSQPSRRAGSSSSSMNLRVQNVNGSTQSTIRKSLKSPKLPGSLASASKPRREPTEIAKLALAHLMTTVPECPETKKVCNDGAGTRPRQEDDDDMQNNNSSVNNACEQNDSGTPSLGGRLRNSLPSYRRLCSILPVADGSPPGAHSAPNSSTMSTVGSRALVNSEGVIAGYMSAIQSASNPDEPTPIIEMPSQDRRDQLQTLYRRKTSLFAEVLKRSVMLIECTQMRTTLADEVRLRFTNHLSDQEKHPNFARSYLPTRARSYWVKMHEAHSSARSTRGQRDFQEAQLINGVFCQRDKMIAMYFWAQYERRMRYSQICSELFLPLGALLDWIVDMGTSL